MKHGIKMILSFVIIYLKQLKPITRRFKHIESLSSQDNDNQLQHNTQILNDDEVENLSLKKNKKFEPIKELQPLQKTKKRSIIRHFQSYAGEEPHPPNAVLSKLNCSKVLHEYEPRLHSHAHGPFLDIAQRFS